LESLGAPGTALRILVSTIVLIAATFIVWAIGNAVRRLAKTPQSHWSVSIGIGLATLICAGGILNLAHIAGRPVMWVVIAACIAVAANEMRRSNADAIFIRKGGTAELALAAAVVAAAILFAIATQLPPREFNYQDDLQKYFAHPVRMLETGTLAGSPLNALGSETLGGQAFLHGIVLSVLPLPYINGVDAIFGFFALMLIAANVAWRRFGRFPGAAAGALLIAIVNPLYANVSGLYTAAVLMATAVLVVADEGEDPSPLLLGLVYGALIALKPSFVVFIAFHLLFTVLALAAPRRDLKRAMTWLARAAGWSLASAAPWIAMFLPTYLAHGTFAARAHLDFADLSNVNLISPHRFLDGDSILPYTALVVIAVYVAVLALVAAKRQGVSESESNSAARDAYRSNLGLFAGAAAGVVSFVTLVVYFSLLTGFEVTVRYSVPFLLGTCAIAALLAPSIAGAAGKLPRWATTAIPAAAILVIIALFAPSSPARYEKAVKYGTILEFSKLATMPEYGPYIQFSLSAGAQEQAAQYQSQVPVGAPILVWIDRPYLLDFRRNPIIDVDTAGTGTPWAHVPSNIQYVLWQYSGYALRKDGDYQRVIHEPGYGARERMLASRSLALANVLSELANHSHVIASSNEYVLFKLQ
jgi:hypothetical protein